MPLAVVLVLILILVAVLVLVLILVLILVVVLVLILVLIVIHGSSSKLFFRGYAAKLAFPAFQLLSLSLKIRLTTRPQVIAAAIPPAVAFSPPVKIPRNPSLSTASRTPLARL